MVFVATPASAKAYIGSNYDGATIEVTQGGTFVLRTTIRWDEVANGYYGVTIYWEDNNHAYDNFTVLYTRAFFDNDNDNLPDGGVAEIENSTTLTIGAGVNGTGYTFSVANTAGNENNGYVDIEIYMLAGSRGVPHRAWDNHPINDFGYGAIDYAEATTATYVPMVTTIKVNAWPGGVVVRGKENSQALDMTGPPPYHLYTKGENAIIAAAQRMGSGAVFAAGTVTSNAYDRWKSAASWPDGRYMDTLYHAAMQWMVPGADNVLWYWGHNVSSFGKFPANDNLVKVYLPALGYTVDNDNTTPITNSWAASKLVGRDILILANLDNGTVGNGGDPSTLLDSEVAIIKEFVDNGGGLIVLDGGDYSTTGRYNMYHISNKVLTKLGFNWRFQSDSIIDDKDNYAYYTPDNIQYWGTQFRVRVLPDSAIGGAYRGETGSENLNEYEPCSLIATPTWSVDVVSILPSPQSQIPPATLTYTVTITNTGTGWDNYNISVAGTNNVNFVRSLNKTKLYLAAGASDSTVIVTENILDNTPLCTWDTITVTATGTENTGGVQATDSANALAHATAAFDVELVSITPESQNGDLNTTVTAAVVALNKGAATDNLTLSITGNTLGWPGVSVAPSVFLNVLPNNTVNATLTIPIPGYELPGVTNEIRVTVTSGGNPLKTDENKAWVTTNLLREVVLVIENQTGGDHQEAILIIDKEWCGKRYDPLSFKVVVYNNGILADKYELSAWSDPAGPTLEIMPPELAIAAGKWDFAELSVTVPENAIGCTTYTIHVRADGQLASGTLWDPVNVSAEDNATVHVAIARCVKVDILTQDQTGTPGSKLKWWIRIKNLGNVDSYYALSISQFVSDVNRIYPEWSYVLEPPIVFVPACSIGQAWVEFEVPMDLKTSVTNLIDVRAVNLDDPMCEDIDWVEAHVLVPGARIPEAWLKVTVDAEVKAIQMWPTSWDIGVLDETEIAGPSPAFTVRNTGNVDVQVTITGSDAKSAPGEPTAKWTLADSIGVDTYAMWFDGTNLSTIPKVLFALLVPTQEASFTLTLQAPGVITVPARMWTVVTLRAS